jgi:hypothetical protein
LSFQSGWRRSRESPFGMPRCELGSGANLEGAFGFRGG